MSLARTVAWNSGVQVGGRLVGLLASLFFNALLIRHLGIATFGQFTAASVYVGLFMILGESGLYLVSVRRAMQEPELRGRILGTALGLRLLWTCIPLGLAFAIAQCIPVQRFPTYQPVVKLVIGIVALNEYIRLLSQFLTAVFRMHLRMDLAVIGEVGSRLVALAGILLVVHAGGGLVSVALAFLAANAVNLAYAWVMAQRLEGLRPQLHRPVVGGLLRESVVVAGVLVLSLLRLQVGTFLLSLLRPAEDVGVYGVAIKVHEVLVTFPGLFIALLYPVLSRLASEDAAKLRHTFQRTFDVMVLAGVAVGLEIVVLAPHITAVLGETRATLPLRILALSLPSVFVGMSFSHLLLAEGRQAIILRLYSCLALASLAANALLIPHYSYVAVATTSAVMETLVLLSLCTYWWRRGMQVQLRVLWAVPLAAAIGSGLLLLERSVLPSEALTLPARVAVLLVAGTLAFALFLGAAWRCGLVQTALWRSLLPGSARGAAVR
ncbi:MAG TPA: oligosaccharide flippase family protein [Candidatus Krumholzibacteria bacterium]|nr:oligosaccharide flippase family protein [Candidatus Krumholzibacteria bacterium]